MSVYRVCVKSGRFAKTHTETLNDFSHLYTAVAHSLFFVLRTINLMFESVSVSPYVAH